MTGESAARLFYPIRRAAAITWLVDGELVRMGPGDADWRMACRRHEAVAYMFDFQ